MLALAGCGRQPAVLAVDAAYVRLAALPSRPAVAYFTIHGGAADTTLIAVSSDVAIKAELHESMTMPAAHAGMSGGMGGAMASMKPIGDVPVRAGENVVFAPGGRHVMLFDVNPGVKPGRKIPLTFTFANNRRVTIEAPSIAAGAPAPAE